MANKKATKRNFKITLEKISKMFEDEPDQQALWVEWLNRGLDELKGDDFFGTEGQCDPRGDQRN